MEQPKSLLPYDDQYVLINKWTLLTNSATITLMAEFIAKMTGDDPQNVAGIFGSKANEYFEGFTNEQVTEQANNLVANFIKFNGTQLVVTNVIETD